MRRLLCLPGVIVRAALERFVGPPSSWDLIEGSLMAEWLTEARDITGHTPGPSGVTVGPKGGEALTSAVTPGASWVHPRGACPACGCA